MATTFLSHNTPKCSGNIVLKTSNLEIFAPSFSIGKDGIKDILLDVKVDSVLTPSYRCLGCSSDITNMELREHVTAKCSSCGNGFKVGELKVHDYLPAVCARCQSAILDQTPGKKSDNSTTAARIAGVLNISKKAVFVDLIEVLTNPFKIK